MRSENDFEILDRMYWTGAHTKHRVMYHIVWLPKYRKRVLNGRLAERVESLLRECSEINDWGIVELNIQADHVHMLIQLRPNISVSKAIQLLKGKSSRVIRKEFPELKEFFWGDSFWSDGFFVETVGQVSMEKIRDYIKAQ